MADRFLPARGEPVQRRHVPREAERRPRRDRRCDRRQSARRLRRPLAPRAVTRRVVPGGDDQPFRSRRPVPPRRARSRALDPELPDRAAARPRAGPGRLAADHRHPLADHPRLSRRDDLQLQRARARADRLRGRRARAPDPELPRGTRALPPGAARRLDRRRPRHKRLGSANSCGAGRRALTIGLAHDHVRPCPAGRAARARARARAGPGGAARGGPAGRQGPRDRGRRRNGEVEPARGGPAPGDRPRVLRAERARDRARAGVPVRGRPPAVRAPGARGRDRGARALARGSRGAVRRGADRVAGRRCPGARRRGPDRSRPAAIPATHGSTACTGSRRTSPATRRWRCSSTTSSGAMRRRRARSRSSPGGSRGSRSR